MKKKLFSAFMFLSLVFGSGVVVSAAQIDLLGLFDSNSDGILTFGDNDRTSTTYPYDNPYQESAHTGPQTFGTIFTLDSFEAGTFGVYITSSGNDASNFFTINGYQFAGITNGDLMYTGDTSYLENGVNSIDFTLGYVDSGWGLDDMKITSFYLEYEPGQSTPAVPEPSTILLLGSGLLGLGWYGRKRKKA